MKRLLPLFLFTHAACVEEPQARETGVLPVFWIDARTDREEIGSFDLIEESCAYWDLTCVDSPVMPGSLIIILTSVGGLSSDEKPLLGFAYYDTCEPVLWSYDDEFALIHEIGHAFTLEHVDDPTNIMFHDRSAGGSNSTFDQRETVLIEADERCP